MYDRWRKLLRSFYNKKKDYFDISKVPDIYDSAKYDAIHNGHLNLDLEASIEMTHKSTEWGRRSCTMSQRFWPISLFQVNTELTRKANPELAQAYVLKSWVRFHAFSFLSESLSGKLLVDLANTHEESVVAAEIFDQSMRNLQTFERVMHGCLCSQEGFGQFAPQYGFWGNWILR